MSLWSVSLDSAVSATVEAMLPCFSPENRAVYVRLHLMMTYFDKETEEAHDAHRHIHMLFVRDSRYTKVMAAVGTHLHEIPTDAWKMTSYHDSCWRSDGFSFLSSVWRDMELQLGGKRSWANAFIDRFQMAEVNLEKYDDGNRYGGSYRPTSVKPVSQD